MLQFAAKKVNIETLLRILTHRVSTKSSLTLAKSSNRKMQSVYFVQISKRRQPSGLNKKKIFLFFFSKTAKNLKITATEEAEKEKICT